MDAHPTPPAMAQPAALSGHPVLAPGILNGFHLLEADAGTGKTWTLSGLVVRALVERGLGIEQVLVVTFTNAATAELAARIRERIGQLARLLEDRLAGRESAVRDPFCLAIAPTLADPVAALGRLRVALARIDEAAVRTIHAFCRRVIDEHALSIGMPAGLEIGNDGHAWIARGLADWWRETVEAASPEVIALLRAARVSPPWLLQRLRAIASRPAARLLPAPGDWRALAPGLEPLRGRLRVCLARDAAALRGWIAVKGNVDGRRFQKRWLEGWLAKLEAFAQGEGEGLIPEEASRLATARFEDADAGRRAPALELIAVCDALVELLPQARALPARVALEAWDALCARREALQRAVGAVGHDELLRVVHEALESPSGEVLARSLRERHPLALVDECQDTDALQWRIFSRIYQPGPDLRDEGLVLVGDPKQAIYAFRSADVYSYLEARAAGPRHHGLHENQRSVRPLIEAVNALFGRPDAFMVPEIGFVPTREGARARRAFEVPAVLARAPMTVVMLAREDEPGLDARMIARPVATQRAVEALVAEAARLLGSGEVRLGGEPLRARDIAVLVDAHWQGTLVKEGLAAAGIGAIEISRDSVFQSRECDELLRVVAAVADPVDRGLVRSALATAMLGRDASALRALDAASEGALDVLEAMAEARRAWPMLGPQAALRRLMGAFAVGPRLAGLRDGERRLTNLMHLLALMSESPEAREGAHAGLRWLGRMQADPSLAGQEAGELRLESDEDLVRIVTVHKSKGLEFPIVFLPFAWAGRAFRADPPLTYHAEGRAVLDLDPEPGPPASPRLLAAREAHAEAVRVAYVALTRAEQRCYLFWGPAAGAQFSPFAWLLHGIDPAEAKPWNTRSKEPPELAGPIAHAGVREWVARACARHPDAMSVTTAEALQAGPGAAGGIDGPVAASGDGSAALAQGAPTPRAAAPAASPAALHARAFTARIPAPWIRSSFTALTLAGASGAHAAEPAGERPDHDQFGDDAAPAPPTLGIRAAFPAGAQAGTCLHGILEHTDFAAGVSSEMVGGWLERSGFGTVDRDAVRDWLSEVVAAPLPGLGGREVQLAALDPRRTVRELEFVLPAQGLDDRALFDAVGRAYPLDTVAAARTWSGMLGGFVDLVFEANDRWYLVDWKSNRLGTEPSAYAGAALEASIGAHGYALQFCLYTLALHRLLRVRLAAYDYDRHFGGVHYVYLRGAGLGGGAGVYSTRPPRALVDTLDRLFEGRR